MAKGDRTKAAAKAALAKTYKPRFKVGDYVWWAYRTAKGWGRIAKVLTVGHNEATTEYAINQVDNHVSASGSHEPATVNHWGSDVHSATREQVEAAAKAAKATGR